MIKLLSTDFDGTLVNHAEPPPVAPELIELFGELRQRGVLWAMNTGRALHHIIEGLEEFQFPFQPDFVLSSERHVFRPSTNGPGWEDFGGWNSRCERDHAVLFEEARPLLREIHLFLEQETAAQAIDDHTGVGLVASSQEELNRIVAFIDRLLPQWPAFGYQRNTLYLRFCHLDYSKGAALGELSRLLEISPDEIFAVGDHYNDIPMLDGQHARWTACPANATEAVKETVLKAGGYVARRTCGNGVVEALEHFLM